MHHFINGNQVCRLPALLLLMIILNGCSLFQPAPELPQNLSPQARSEYLSQLDYWQLTGRIGIIANGESNSANISWKKNQQSTTVRIYGALGATYALVTQTPAGATIKLSDDEVYQGDDAQLLLWQTTGWHLPINQMQQWILGLHKNAPQYQLNEQGYVESIAFDQWQLAFNRYQSFYGLDMPKKLRATHPDITIKFAIYDWAFVADE